jgi:hypothetical protein
MVAPRSPSAWWVGSDSSEADPSRPSWIKNNTQSRGSETASSEKKSQVTTSAAGWRKNWRQLAQARPGAGLLPWFSSTSAMVLAATRWPKPRARAADTGDGRAGGGDTSSARRSGGGASEGGSGRHRTPTTAPAAAAGLSIASQARTSGRRRGRSWLRRRTSSSWRSPRIPISLDHCSGGSAQRASARERRPGKRTIRVGWGDVGLANGEAAP